MQRTSEPHGDSLRAVCAGVSGLEAWDAVTSLRGELYTSEHLATHAGDVARAHGEPSLRSTPGPLRKRFAAARSQLKAAYEILSRDAKNKRDPSPAEEWLLDNSHVVDEQIREIQEDLPWGYLIELPRVSSGPMRGYPRVYGLCLDYLRHTDAHVDLHSLAEYVVAYQRVSTLTIGELWAVPIMLRLGLTLIVGALAVSAARAQDPGGYRTAARLRLGKRQMGAPMERAVRWLRGRPLPTPERTAHARAHPGKTHLGARCRVRRRMA